MKQFTKDFRMKPNITKSYILLSAAYLMVALPFMSNLEAGVQIESTYYPAETVPSKYKADNQDCTVIELEGWPKNRTINVFETSLTRPDTVKQENTLKSLDGSEKIVLVVSSIGYIPGDQVTYEFKDSKRRLSKKITITPNPIYAKSSIDSAKIEAKLVGISPANYSFVLEGFGQGEELLFKSISYDECIEYKLKYDKKTVMKIMPGVINKKGGIDRVSFTRPSGEVLKVELPWGLEWIKYCLYYDKDRSARSVLEDEKFQKENPEIIEYFKTKR